ncbi:MAG: hypothetical protein OQL06_10290 [Gammaproteobacteria bacterium]|nr:hypothetical protein [Gammaproteobacteria bacterium]
MLRAIRSNHPAKKNRVWFSDQQHDLFVWFDNHNKPIAFQFSYNKNINEHSISWSEKMGYSHDKIDNGEPGDGSYKMTPIMMPDGIFDGKKIAEEFKRVSLELDTALTDFIYQTLLSYAK